MCDARVVINGLVGLLSVCIAFTVEKRRRRCDKHCRPYYFTYDQIALKKFSNSSILEKVSGEVPLLLELPEFPYNTVQDRWKEASVPKISSIH